MISHLYFVNKLIYLLIQIFDRLLKSALILFLAYLIEFFLHM